MDIQVKMTPLSRNDAIKAVGSVNLGDITVRNFTLMENSKGELFLNMPNKDSGRKDSDGKKIYEEIAHPVTKELRDVLNNAAIESYKEGRPVFMRDKEDGSLMVEAQVFDAPFYNRVGKSQILINDKFVIKNIFINEGKDKNMYVTMPNYKTNSKGKDGKDIYKEIVVMSSSLKAKISEAIIDEYKKEKAYKEQNRFSIKSRLEEAKKKAYENKPDTKVRQKEAVL